MRSLTIKIPYPDSDVLPDDYEKMISGFSSSEIERATHMAHYFSLYAKLGNARKAYILTCIAYFSSTTMQTISEVKDAQRS